jgi:Glycosyl hydrolases family 16
MRIFPYGNHASDFHQQRKRLSFRLVTLVVIGSLILTALSFVPSSRISSARAASWSLIWSDEFSGAANTGVNTPNWLYDTGTSYPGGAANWGTGEVETMSSSTTNVFLDGVGHLVIDPVKDGNGNWTSGRIETQRTDFAAPAGGELEVTASIQMPTVTGSATLGYWPAFWMLGSAFRGVYTNWPSAGEIDIMEGINGLNKVYGTLHCGTDPGGPCNETIGLGGNTACATTTCEDGYHTYTAIVDRNTSPEQIRWYVDGTEYWSVSSDYSGMDATTWANAVDHGFFIILNVAMGGAFPNAVCSCTSPSSSTVAGYGMHVDYVRVYTSPN